MRIPPKTAPKLAGGPKLQPQPVWIFSLRGPRRPDAIGPQASALLTHMAAFTQIPATADRPTNTELRSARHAAVFPSTASGGRRPSPMRADTRHQRHNAPHREEVHGGAEQELAPSCPLIIGGKRLANLIRGRPALV